MWILFIFAIFCFGLAIAAFVEALNSNEPILFVAVVFCAIFGITLFNLANKGPVECWKCCNQMNESQYCTECGKEKPAEYKNWTCCEREHDKDIKFCPDCGSPKPVVVDNSLWNCSCGQTNISSKFCPNCGTRKPETNTNWDCANCGQKNISSNFCPNCGSKKG